MSKQQLLSLAVLLLALLLAEVSGVQNIRAHEGRQMQLQSRDAQSVSQSAKVCSVRDVKNKLVWRQRFGRV